ncbi:MAG: hypothetical protein HYY04_02320 [Chloroflexi bacterium]|nr:hypothetical protein [Chloroflexota bacterium]
MQISDLRLGRGSGCALALAALFVVFVWLTGRTTAPDARPTGDVIELAQRMDAKVEEFQDAARLGRARLEIAEDELNARIAVGLADQASLVRVRAVRVHLRRGEAAVEGEIAIGRFPIPQRVEIPVLATVRPHATDGTVRLSVEAIDLGWVDRLPVLPGWMRATLRQRLGPDGDQYVRLDGVYVDEVDVEPGVLLIVGRPV